MQARYTNGPRGVVENPMLRTFAFYRFIFMLGLVGGAAFLYFKPWPYDALRQAYRGTDPAVQIGLSRRISSQFIDLDLQKLSFVANNSYDDSAGAIAPAGGLGIYMNDALLVDGHGKLFFLSLDDLQFHRLNIEPPPNGRRELYAYDDRESPPKYEADDWHRYTDVAYNNGYIYLIYSHFDLELACFATRVSRLAVTAPIIEFRADVHDWETIFSSQPCFGFRDRRHAYAGQQAGGKLAVSVDGKRLFMTIGDYEFDGLNVPNYPQDRTVDYGKVLELDLESESKRRVVSIGHRNQQGITVTPDGAIWSTEHGPQGGDELNLVIEGGNYGWPYETYGTLYGQRDWPVAENKGRHERFRQPSWAWVPSVGTSSVTYVRDFHETWDGNLVVGSLKGMSLFRVVTDGAHVITMERVEIGERVREIIGHRGFLLAYMDTGNIFRIGAVTPPLNDHVERLRTLLSATTLEHMDACLECHGRGIASDAPTLCTVLGREIGGDKFANYSDALKRQSGVWDSKKLASFLENAEGIIPGTTMPNPGIADPEIRMDIVDNLSYFCASDPAP